MESPLKELRLSAGLTIDQLASAVGISRLAIIRNEQACYANPSPAIVDFFNDKIDETFLTLYREFQIITRRSNYGILDPEVLESLLSTHPNFPFPDNPVAIWRTNSNLSKAAISVLYCIHPDIVSRIECRPHLLPNCLPNQFIQSLLESGYSKDSLDGLNSLFRNYRETINRTQNPDRSIKAS